MTKKSFTCFWGPPTIYRHHKGVRIKKEISKRVVYELSEPKRTTKRYTTPKIALAMFIMAFVGVLRGLWGSIVRERNSAFRATPRYPGKNPEISRPKVWFPWVSSDIPNFWAGYLAAWKTPTPPEEIRTQKFGFVLFFLAWSTKVAQLLQQSCRATLCRTAFSTIWRGVAGESRYAPWEGSCSTHAPFRLLKLFFLAFHLYLKSRWFLSANEMILSKRRRLTLTGGYITYVILKQSKATGGTLQRDSYSFIALYLLICMLVPPAPLPLPLLGLAFLW